MAQVLFERGDSFCEMELNAEPPEHLPPIKASKAKLSPRKQKIKLINFPKVRVGAGCSTSINSRSYKYKILPGNNSRVVMMALKRRPWWHPILGTDDDESILSSSPTLIWEMYRSSKRYKDKSYEGILMNHLQRNNCLVTKKGLYLTLRSYCQRESIDILQIIPKTFYLASGVNSKSMRDDDMAEFMKFNDDFASSHALELDSSSCPSPTNNSATKEDIVYILKPASKTNRGFGIKVVRGCSAVLNVVNRVSSSCSKASTEPECDGDASQQNLTRAAKRIASQDGWIVQLYMDRPLLISGRKFDIRCFVLVTHSQRKGLRAYFYDEAYVRTSSKKYSMSKLTDRETHLTNDAVQKHSKSYGKFEDGNKLCFAEWQALISVEYPHAPPDVVAQHIFPEIKRLSKLSIAAAAETLVSTHMAKSFELFGYDYMVDEAFQPFLIEVNTNPCLEFVCPLLTNLITNLVDESIKVAVDPEFPPPPESKRTKACSEAIEAIAASECKFEPLYP